MKLNNPFPEKVRLLYLYVYGCFKCGRSDRGLELHHITGRDSDSAFNACPLCKDCHAKIGHTEEEEKELLAIVMKFHADNSYKPEDNDYDFIFKHANLIKNNPRIEKWLAQ